MPIDTSPIDNQLAQFTKDIETLAVPKEGADDVLGWDLLEQTRNQVDSRKTDIKTREDLLLDAIKKGEAYKASLAALDKDDYPNSPLAPLTADAQQDLFENRKTSDAFIDLVTTPSGGQPLADSVDAKIKKIPKP